MKITLDSINQLILITIMKMKNLLTALSCIFFLNTQAQETINTQSENSKNHWRIKCLNENNEESFLKWTESGRILECEKVNGQLDIHLEGKVTTKKLQEVYEPMLMDLRKRYNTTDFLVFSIEIYETNKELTISVKYLIPSNNNKNEFRMILQNEEPK